MTDAREFMRRAGQGPLLSVAGGAYDILATGHQTGGGYALLVCLIPSGVSTPPHTHTREEEAFYVLEGELTFTVAGRRHVASTGTFVHTPRAIEHSFHNTGTGKAVALVFVTPAGLENFFREVGDALPPGSYDPLPSTPEHLAKLLEVAPRYGVHIRMP